ncbi:energy transducer TonB [Erythrobacter sp. sf7]|uniref:Energy transducer TonB n=1 Tax=Erythrobacter fulvus TaxID=2987523 RepID=A0ABT5JRC3_9SPHN|nr:energy transducer TonB [Erythrobacter fulvus]MDC8755223.1 energy transducer TonB [Erythrobacter fulvus]
MMGDIAFRNEEKVGLLVAVVLHGALVAVLLMQAVRSEVSVFPERMTVSLATEVGLEAASPDPVAESRAAIAPTLADDPAPAPEPAPAERVERAEPTPPKPTARAVSTQPAPTRERSRPDRTLAAKPSPAPAKAAEKGGGSRIGDDFLEGKGSSTTTDETRAPAAKFGSAERAALASAITRQLRPHWTAPSGVDAERLVSTVSWDLNPDGTLRGRPRCKTDPASITTSNQPQAGLHCERAIRAVQLAAPFNLPEQFYDRWKALEWQFDRRL